MTKPNHTTILKKGLFTTVKKQVITTISYDNVCGGYFPLQHTTERIYKVNRLTGKKKTISCKTLESVLRV